MLSRAAQRQRRSGGELRQRVLRGAFLFPALMIAMFLGLTAAGVSGSSSAMVHEYLDGNTNDPHELVGHPQPIRSDEWLVATSMTVDQTRHGLPLDNTSIGSGQTVCLLLDAPCLDWSMIVKPQQWGYLILPDAQAFAFKWWLLPLVGIIGAYTLALQLLPRRRWFAALFSLGAVLTPYTAWWFLNSTFAVLSFSLVIASASLRLLTATSRRRRAGCAALIGWALGCVGVVLYPPFIIPCVEVVALFVAGLLVMRARELGRRSVVAPVVALAGSAAGGGAIVGAYLLTRHDAVSAELNSEYPGHRVVSTGGTTVSSFFDGSLTPHLRQPSVGAGLAGLGGNQSEAAASLPIGVLLAVVAVVLLVRAGRRGVALNWVLIGQLALLAVFLLDLFVPGLNLVAHLFLLHLVEHGRLQLAFGLQGALLLVAVLWELDRQDVRLPRLLALALGVAGLGALIAVGLQVRHTSAVYGGPTRDIVLFAGVIAVALVLVGRRRAVPAAALLLAFELYAAGTVNPLYRGLPDVAGSPLGRAVTALDAAHPGAWVGIGWPVSEVVLEQTGVHTYSATFSYPSLRNWTELDPTGANLSVYDRYAHVSFTTSPGPALRDVAPDFVLARFDACGAFAQRRIQHVLSSETITSPCVRDAGTVTIPTGIWHLYDVVAAEAK